MDFSAMMTMKHARLTGSWKLIGFQGRTGSKHIFYISRSSTCWKILLSEQRMTYEQINVAMSAQQGISCTWSWLSEDWVQGMRQCRISNSITCSPRVNAASTGPGRLWIFAWVIIGNGLCCIAEDDPAKMGLTICWDVSQKNINASVNVHGGDSEQEEGGINWSGPAHLGHKASSAAKSSGLILIWPS
jgi:hypothetical protein